MAIPPWLDQLRQHLQEQGLPPPYVERLLQELTDHLHDIQEEKNRMQAQDVHSPAARMGQPSHLAQFIGSEHRKHYFSQKHPVVFFALMPVLLLLAIWSALMLLSFIVGAIVGESADSPANTLATRLISHAVIWLPVALTTVLFCRTARHRRMSWRWSLLTAGVLAIFPGLTIRLTPSTLTIGLLPALSFAAFIQFLLPLAIAGWYTWRGHRLQHV